jgi:hypothetical protein
MSNLSGRYKIVTRQTGMGHTTVFIADPESETMIAQILFVGSITKDEKLKVVGDLGTLLKQSTKPPVAGRQATNEGGHGTT